MDVTGYRGPSLPYRVGIVSDRSFEMLQLLSGRSDHCFSPRPLSLTQRPLLQPQRPLSLTHLHPPLLSHHRCCSRGVSWPCCWCRTQPHNAFKFVPLDVSPSSKEAPRPGLLLALDAEFVMVQPPERLVKRSMEVLTRNSRCALLGTHSYTHCLGCMHKLHSMCPCLCVGWA